MASGTVYCYLPAPAAWEGKLRQNLAIHGLRMKKLGPADAGEKLGYLVGLQGFEKAPEGAPVQPPEEAMLIFHGITGSRLEGGLRALMKAGVPREAYKSIVTAENAKWDLCQLRDELKKEREALETGEGSPHGKTTE